MAHVWHTVDDVPAAFAALLADRRPASIALSGGGTARDCYEAAAHGSVDWSSTAFWFGDERFVPVTDPDSNEGMARAVGLDRVPVGPLHSMTGAAPGGDIEAPAAAYEMALRASPPL